MKRQLLFAALMIAVTAGAAVPRLVNLGNRPMHCDEANQAVKFGLLLESGFYQYDPNEHHGPSLNYLTLPVAWLASASKLTEISEFHLRLIPAIFGTILVGLIWLLRDELGHGAAFCAAVLTAISPAMVFFSRYYIQEMLLVCFTFGAIVALFRFVSCQLSAVSCQLSGARSEGRGAVANFQFSIFDFQFSIPQVLWLVLLGLCVGMMHASKETCVIPLFAMALAAAVAIPSLRRIGAKRLILSGLIVVVTAAGISALFYSSFLNNPPGVDGVADSYATYGHYFERALGQGTTGPHDKPWYYYFQILFWWHRGGGTVWTEASIAVLALAGLVAGALGKGIRPANLPIARFFGIYTVVMTVIYSAISYKTPWCALGMLHGMILLGGIGAVVLIRAAPGRLAKAVVIVLLVAAGGHLACQSYRASFVACEDPNNPYVYAHTTSDVPRLAQRIRRIAAAGPDGQAIHIQVICPDHDHWPLPWYLRGFSRVDWFPGMPRGRLAPLIITKPEMERALMTKLSELFDTMPPGQQYSYRSLLPRGDKPAWQLRPHVPLRVYIRSDLWEAYRAGG